MKKEYIRHCMSHILLLKVFRSECYISLKKKTISFCPRRAFGKISWRWRVHAELWRIRDVITHGHRWRDRFPDDSSIRESQASEPRHDWQKQQFRLWSRHCVLFIGELWYRLWEHLLSQLVFECVVQFIFEFCMFCYEKKRGEGLVSKETAVLCRYGSDTTELIM